LLDGAGARLIALQAVTWVEGVPPVATVAATVGSAARFDLRMALRRLAQRRVAVTVQLRDGSSFAGVPGRVGADHVELAVPPSHRVRSVPLAALATARFDL
jgi:hypothetical protein